MASSNERTVKRIFKDGKIDGQNGSSNAYFGGRPVMSAHW